MVLHLDYVHKRKAAENYNNSKRYKLKKLNLYAPDVAKKLRRA